MTYQPKTDPFPYQQEEFDLRKDVPAWGVLWEQGCVDCETEYLTLSGWRKINQFQGGPVGQWHPEDSRVTFVEPTDYIKKPCEEMYILRNQRELNQMLSREHRVPFFMEKEGGEMQVLQMHEIDEMLNDDKKAAIYLPVKFTAPLTGSGTGQSDDWIRLQTAIALMGYTPFGKEGSPYVNVEVKAHGIRRMKRLIDNSSGSNKVLSVTRGKKRMIFKIQVLVSEFDRSWWTTINEHERKVIIDELSKWRNPQGQIYIRSRQSADFLQYIMASQGKNIHMTFLKDRGHFIRESVANRIKLTWRNFGKVPSTDGFKYCFEVPTKFLILRRDGVIFASGNTGKSKVIVDKFCYNYEKGVVDTLVVMAPPGVERNWVTDELKDHMPDKMRENAMIRYFQTKRASTKWHQQEMADLVAHRGCSILTMTYPGFMTKHGKQVHWDLHRKRKVFALLDEAQKAKSEEAAITKAVIGSGQYAVMRSITSGTLGAEGPMDVYHPIHFLDPTFWAKHGLGSYPTFKNFFAEWEKVRTPIPGRKTKNGFQVFAYFDVCTGVKNIDVLRKILPEISSRVTKDVLGLPPKLYSKLYFEMNKEQERAYETLKEEYCVEIDGAFIDAEMAVTRLMRLQQITCGYVHEAADEPKILIGPNNPRLDAVVDYALDLPHQAIIWARFTSDIDQLMERLGDKATRYDGKVDPDQAMANKEKFQRGDAQFFVANAQKGATGLTLTMAKTVIYYSNSFKLEERMQSEDRAHRYGTDSPVNYIDVIAPNTVDEKIVESLRRKYDIFHQINGDELKGWI